MKPEADGKRVCWATQLREQSDECLRWMAAQLAAELHRRNISTKFINPASGE